MANYLTQDLTIDFGDEMPEDSTLNMLRFPQRNTTLVIARSAIEPQQSLDEALTAQLELLRNKTQTLTISPRQVTYLGNDEHVEGREMSIQFEVGNTPNFQLQVACLIPGQARMLVLNYSKPGPLSDTDIAHWQAIKHATHLS